MKINLQKVTSFENRHNGPTSDQVSEMLQVIGAESIETLIDETIPKAIRLKNGLNLPEAKSEFIFINELKKLAQKNQVFKSYIGLGYYNCIVPPVIQRNILENPGWYTAYTPYQAEIAQGRLEALINYQTMVSDLTGMELANASLLDEGTAAAEAMAMFYALRKGNKKKADTFFVDQNTFPQTIDILKTRSEPVGINLKIGSLDELDLTDENIFGVLIQYPDSNGAAHDYQAFTAAAHEQDILVSVAADLLSLTLLTEPGAWGADCVVGTTQRFGVPMGYGGPHAAYFATKEQYKRQIPGRIIGVSLDAYGKPAYRMALQTREQHIKRDKATSNICTAQVLLAVMAGMYAVYHGPKGLKSIAEGIHGMASLLNEGLKYLGYQQVNDYFFDTLKVAVEDAEKLKTLAESREMNFRYSGDGFVGVAIDETTSLQDVLQIASVFAEVAGKDLSGWDVNGTMSALAYNWPEGLQRKSAYLEQEVFGQYHAEHEMLRYIKKLENKDLSLVHSMISLGSCTMKLNATTEMMPITWPEFGSLHPFAPVAQAAGYHEIFRNLEAWLCEITGFEAVSLQPNSGAQGEYAGLLTIMAYHKSRGEGHRNITLIPTSAHGTNFASAVMVGNQVVLVQCDENGNIDTEDLKAKAEKHRDHLASLMVTYPSTHGVFEEEIMEICQAIHSHGGLVYMDGANMNAQVGLTSPANIGADVCHLNLHKTFCIPHGGGGPGMGPIGVAKHLAPFLPGNPLVKAGGEEAITAVSAAPYGSASILLISYAYIAMMGGEGLKKATQTAILNANYIKEKLKGHYKVLYTGKNGRSAHEMIIDCREFKKAGIDVTDIAKRLMDYGFHAPTVSFPVAGTMMIEPTESEAKPELDRFCDALIAIRQEIQEVEDGQAEKEDNVLKNAPHTAQIALTDEWPFSYSREKAVYPLPYIKESKFWPSVSRIDNAYGDRNLMCSCISVEAFQDAVESKENVPA